MKFNIISREPYWLQKHKEYTFTYQENGQPERHKIQMIYVGYGKYYFLSSSLDTKSWSDDEEARDEFLNELHLWSKGGSYRKTHPIVTTDYEDLLEERKVLQSELLKLENKIMKANEEERMKKYNKYCSDTDTKTLSNFEKSLNDLIGKDYCLRRIYYRDVTYLSVYDLKEEKHRAIITLYDDQIEFSKIPEHLIDYIYK